MGKHSCFIERNSFLPTVLTPEYPEYHKHPVAKHTSCLLSTRYSPWASLLAPL